MAMNFQNLDPLTRARMLRELDSDIEFGRLYISPRLSSFGTQDWPAALRAAVEAGSDQTLAQWLTQPGRLNAVEPRNTKNGTTMVRVPVTAPQTLAEGEFNRLYMRGLCLRALEEGKTTVTAYRAKQVETPRAESVAIEGKSFGSEAVLKDLRANIGIDTILGLPPGPNSGMSVRM
jgi:hypothetical protein